jgi:seryl-tRNA synthetase
MVDLTLAHENPALFIELVKKKDPAFDAELLVELDKKVRIATKHVEELRHRKNELSEMAKKGITNEIRTESIAIGKELKEQEINLQSLQEPFKQLYLRCPNIPDAEVPQGGKEANVVVKEVGKNPTFAFQIKNHLELGTSLGWFDFEASATMTGSNFVLYKNDSVKLMYALVMFMLKHNASYGFSYVIPPYLVNETYSIDAPNFFKTSNACSIDL